ncbi:MAG: serine protease [Blastocatellia bacterium]
MIKRHIAFKAAVAFFLFGLSARPAAAQEGPTRLIEKIRPAVVALIAYNDRGEVIEWGNGFFISRDGRLLTSRHLLKGASRAEVQTREGKVYPVNIVIAEDPDLDLIQLLIDLKEDEVPCLGMADVRAIRGEKVTVFGHQHIVSGTVSYVRVLSEPGQSFLISAASVARATGGPVVNKKGEVIAIATQQAAGDQTVTLAIASSAALQAGQTHWPIGMPAIEGEPPILPSFAWIAGVAGIIIP